MVSSRRELRPRPPAGRDEMRAVRAPARRRDGRRRDAVRPPGQRRGGLGGRRRRCSATSRPCTTTSRGTWGPPTRSVRRGRGGWHDPDHRMDRATTGRTTSSSCSTSTTRCSTTTASIPDLRRHLAASSGRRQPTQYLDDLRGAAQRARLRRLPRRAAALPRRASRAIPTCSPSSSFLVELPVRQPALPRLARRHRRAAGTWGPTVILLRRRRRVPAAQDRALRAVGARSTGAS